MTIIRCIVVVKYSDKYNDHENIIPIYINLDTYACDIWWDNGTELTRGGQYGTQTIGTT